MPTMKAYVPVPPESPEVSVSRKANFDNGISARRGSFAHCEINVRGKEQTMGEMP
jgi:hypothetical protein